MLGDLLAVYYIVGLASVTSLFVRDADATMISLEMQTPTCGPIARAALLCVAVALGAAVWPILIFLNSK
jgi:hypothetical protein